MSGPRTYGYDRVKLADAYSVAELVEMAAAIRADPANANPALGKGCLHLYAPAARAKLDNISWAIRYRQASDKGAAA